MPSPVAVFTQTIPQCAESVGLSIDETNLDRGLVNVHANCCRSFATNIAIRGDAIVGGMLTNLFVEESIPTCGSLSAGVKHYSGASGRICGGTIAGSYSGNGTISGTTFTGSGNGALVTGITGGIHVDFTGSATSPTTGTLSGTISGAVTGTFSGSFSGGASSVTFTITDPSGVTLSASGAFSISGSTFSFSSNLTGSTGSPIEAYWTCEWTDCAIGGVVLQQRAVADDAVLAEYGNDIYPIKSGIRGQLNRRFISCDHPCWQYRTAQQLERSYPSILCFVPGINVATCIGQKAVNRPTATWGTAGDALGKPAEAMVFAQGDSLATTPNAGPLSGSISLSMTGTASNGFVSQPATLSFTFNAGDGTGSGGAPGGGFCSISFNPVTGLYSIVESAAGTSWSISDGTFSLTGPSFSSSGGLTALHPGFVGISGLWVWTGSAWPSICAGYTLTKTNEGFSMSVPGAGWSFTSDANQTNSLPGSVTINQPAGTFYP